MAKPLVLCIDDDPDNLRIRELVLQELGYDTLVASDGDSGLQLFQVADINIVILDYAMPGLNGAQVAGRMRALKPAVPILMFSGLTTVPDDVDGQVDAYLVKGRPVEELAQHLEGLLRVRKTPSPSSGLPDVRKTA